jgi:hypothetical protein
LITKSDQANQRVRPLVGGCLHDLRIGAIDRPEQLLDTMCSHGAEFSHDFPAAVTRSGMSPIANLAAITPQRAGSLRSGRNALQTHSFART